MIEKYPEIALERFDKSNFWIFYFVLKIRKFLKDSILEVGAGCGSFTRGYMKNFQSITSALGCVKVDTLTIDVVPSYSPDITLTASDTNILCGDSVFMNVDLGGGIPAVCGPSGSTACSAPSSTNVVGTNMGTNSNTVFPAPVGAFKMNFL